MHMDMISRWMNQMIPVSTAAKKSETSSFTHSTMYGIAQCDCFQAPWLVESCDRTTPSSSTIPTITRATRSASTGIGSMNDHVVKWECTSATLVSFCSSRSDSKYMYVHSMKSRCTYAYTCACSRLAGACFRTAYQTLRQYCISHPCAM